MGQILRAGWLQDWSHLMLHQKLMKKEWQVSRCIVMVQHPSLVSSLFRPLSLHSLSQLWHDIQVKLSIDCLITWNKLIIGNVHQINNTFTFDQLWCALLGHVFDSPANYDDCAIVLIWYPYVHVSSSAVIKFSSACEWSNNSWLSVTQVCLLLIYQEMWHKFCSKLMHIQFFSQNSVVSTSSATS